MAKINLSLKQIYKKLCPDCQAKVRDLVKEKMADQAVKQALEGKSE